MQQCSYTMGLCSHKLKSCSHMLISCTYMLKSCSHTPRSCSHTPRSCSHTPRSCSHTPRSCTNLWDCLGGEQSLDVVWHLKTFRGDVSDVTLVEGEQTGKRVHRAAVLQVAHHRDLWTTVSVAYITHTSCK